MDRYSCASSASALKPRWRAWPHWSAERKRHELDPVLETIRQCRQMVDESSIGNAAKDMNVATIRHRLDEMEEFMKVTNRIFEQFVGNARTGLPKFVRLLLKTV